MYCGDALSVSWVIVLWKIDLLSWRSRSQQGLGFTVTVSSDLLDLLQPNLVWWYISISRNVLFGDWLMCLRSRSQWSAVNYPFIPLTSVSDIGPVSRSQWWQKGVTDKGGGGGGLVHLSFCNQIRCFGELRLILSVVVRTQSYLVKDYSFYLCFEQALHS